MNFYIICVAVLALLKMIGAISISWLGVIFFPVLAVLFAIFAVIALFVAVIVAVLLMAILAFVCGLILSVFK